MAKKQIEIEGTDTPLSNLCDEFLDARAAVETKRKEYQALEKRMIELMRQTGKKSIKHGGITIRQVHQEEKDKIQVVTVD